MCALFAPKPQQPQPTQPFSFMQTAQPNPQLNPQPNPQPNPPINPYSGYPNMGQTVNIDGKEVHAMWI